MAKNPEDIIIKRSRAKKPTADDNKETQNEHKETSENKGKSSIIDNNLYAKIFASLLMLFAVLLFFSLISYTPKDELNAKVTISEFFGVFSSDSMIRIKVDTTYNWLGLLGAVIANVMINWTIGYFIIALPIFLFLWGLSIFKTLQLSDKLIRNTIIYLIFSVLICSFIGTFRGFSWAADLPKEWTGAIGIFVSTILSKIIGPVGAFLLLLVLLIAVLAFGTNIKWKPVLDMIIKIAIVAKELSVRFFKYIFVKVRDFEKANKSMLSDKEEIQEEVPSEQEEVQPQSAEEPPKPKEIIEQSVPVIKKSSSESSYVMGAYKPHGAFPASSKTSNNEEEIADSIRKSLNIKIEKPAMDVPLPDKPLGLKGAAKEEVVVVSGIKNREQSNIDVPISEDDIENEEILDILPNETPISEDIDEIQETVVKEATGEYFKVDDNDEIPEIDEALLISNKPQPSVKKILPPEPIKIPAPSPSAKPALVIHLEEAEPEEEPSLKTTLGVGIHDENIDYKAPNIKLLDLGPEEMKVSDEELKMNAQILQEKLETFKIFIEDLTVTPGPVVTQYEFVPAAGIKISRIESLSDDLAMALKAKGIRIIAPIPGKGTVGIEIPNLNPSMVRFSHVVNTTKFYESNAKLPMALGKTISGEVLVTDLAKAPHLLIAGSTGSGKSVGINTIINSLLYRMSPSDLKFVIVDPKKVELQQYSRLRYHFIAMSPDIDDAIITNPQDAVSILKSVVLEMENRYDILAKAGQRNIADYNDKVKAGAYKNVKDFDHRPMPYIVVIIDELADLMLTASKEVEEPIIRLAQMARAIGIHLIIATQRPSVDVITGIIKANFPARLAYLVASKIDSRTILDVSGAEQLLGNGDMLFLPGGSPKPQRIQNAFISTDEVDNICNFIGKQDGYSQPYLLPSITDDSSAGGTISADDRDPLFADAAKLVIQHQQASVSLVQRRLKVGYARAGRIIDELEDAGIVGPNEGSKARIVLLDSEAELERII